MQQRASWAAQPADVSCWRVCRGLETSEELAQIKEKVHAFSSSFAMPGFDVTDLAPSNGKAANGVANGHLSNGNGHLSNGNGHVSGNGVAH